MPWVNDPYEWMDPEVGRSPSLWVNPPRVHPVEWSPARHALKEVIMEVLTDKRNGSPQIVTARGILGKYGSAKVSEVPEHLLEACIADFQATLG